MTHAIPTCILKAQKALFAVHEIIALPLFGDDAFGPTHRQRVHVCNVFARVEQIAKIFSNDKAGELKNKARNGCEAHGQKMNGKKVQLSEK